MPSPSTGEATGQLGTASEPDGHKSSQPEGLVDAFLDRNAPLVVSATYWFEPRPEPLIQSATIQLVGRRLEADSPPRPGDEFVHEQTLSEVLAGSGPIAVTAKVRDVNPGEWDIKARLLPQAQAELHWAGSAIKPPPPTPVFRASWSWRRWRLSPGPALPVSTCLAPLVRPPAVVLGSWAVFVPLGIVVALIIQPVVMAAARLQVSHILMVSLLALLAGAIGAKAWYMALHWREHRWEGWAVGGFLAGAGIALPVLLVLLRIPMGEFLDGSAPSLMFGLAVGRLGCFFTGCCAGRPTASRFGVWSSNRSIGARRVPAQLLESASALIIGLPVLAALLTSGSRHGSLFVAAFAAYTLIRQALLLVREERGQSLFGIAAVSAIAAIALAVSLALIAGA